MQVRNQKTEKVHRALRQFLAPKLRPGVHFDATPFLIGVHDGNLADRIDDVIGAVCRATSGDLVFDAVVPELRRNLKKAVDEPQPDGTTKGGEVDEDIVAKVLALLEMRLTPSELSAVKTILMSKPSKGGRYDPGNDTAEDARIAYDQRWPDAARIRVEPSCTPAPQRQSPPASMSDYAKRFPNAMRIGQA
ncbi:hypothetical protein IYY11_21085 [Methylocystis sp. H62]|uniref:hypothetical protein n=1 Tax=Methylocystis sp. H62 TaxID=2785789 RepID=UPI0018C2C2BF|nr:hypothetical protein [Methylocystis sp. H62]MBG0795858.1 hypothetical protein [Methylocystis sp. H62]